MPGCCGNQGSPTIPLVKVNHQNEATDELSKLSFQAISPSPPPERALLSEHLTWVPSSLSSTDQTLAGKESSLMLGSLISHHLISVMLRKYLRIWEVVCVGAFCDGHRGMSCHIGDALHLRGGFLFAFDQDGHPWTFTWIFEPWMSLVFVMPQPAT